MSMKLSDNKDADVTVALRSFREGDRVKVKILSVDVEKRRISLGLKPSYFEQDDFAEADSMDEDEPAGHPFGVVEGSEEESDNDEVSNEEDEGVEEDEEAEKGSDDEDDDEEGVAPSDVEISMNIDLDINSAPHTTSSTTPSQNQQSASLLKLDSGFQWSASRDEEDVTMESSSDEDEETHDGKRKKRRRKEVELDLTADLHTKTPESTADFERLLLGSPNSSYLWVQYMSFQLQLAEIEKAREVAQRALKTINFREEQEKFNVWIALLNLENTYGTDESLETTFKEAARRNDSKTIHLALASILEDSGKTEVCNARYM